MISFSRIPYGEAVERAARQDRTVRNALLFVAVGLVALLVLVVLLWS